MPELSFDIKSSKDFYKKLLDDYAEYKKDRVSSGKALNCAMVSWHLSEWIANEENPGATDREIKNRVNDFILKCPSLSIMKDIANGTKHFNITKYKPEVDKTHLHHGDFNQDFSRDFNISSLIITMKDGEKKYFEDEIETVVNFWKDYFNEHNNHSQ